MAISIKHAKTSVVSDGANTSLVQPSDWNANLVTSMATSRLLGRTTASAGSFEEISAGATLTLNALTLSVNTTVVATLNTENMPLTGGASVTSKNLGTISSGTLTLDMGDRSLQHYTANGAHTLAPGTETGSCWVDITNGSGAGAITTTGWTMVVGSPFTVTSGHKFRCSCSVGNAGSLLMIQALQ